MKSLVDGITEHLEYECDGDINIVLGELDNIKTKFCNGEVDKFIQELADKIKSVALENDMCPECGVGLELKYENEVHNHLDDKPIERWCYQSCPSCYWNNKDD